MTAAQHTVRLPFNEIVLDEQRLARAALLRAEDLVRDGTCANGYMRVEWPHAVDYLLLYGGTTHSAYRFNDGRFKGVGIPEMFEQFAKTNPLRLTLCSVDAGLALLLAVMWQNEPALRLTSSLADIAAVATEMLARKQSTVLLISRGYARSLVYCKDGSPLAVYFAPGERDPSAGGVRDRVLAYLAAGSTEETSLEAFHKLHSKRDVNGIRRFSDLLAGTLGPPPFFLKVKHGSQVVARRLIQSGSASIGRGAANDVVIDHRSISREHSVISWSESGFIVADKGSANGTHLNGQKITRNQLAFGNVINIGEFEIHFLQEEEEEETQEKLSTLFIPGGIAIKQIPSLMFNGEMVKIETPVFSIGKGAESSLRIKGFRVRPVQATIVREAEGQFRLIGNNSGPTIKLNGSPIEPSGALLTNADQIVIGRHKLAFILPEE